MDRKILKLGIENPYRIFLEERESILDLSINACSREIKHIVAMEELAECAQEVSKFARNEGDKLGLIEEIADVYLSLEMILKMNNIDICQISDAITVKLDRERQRRTKPNEPVVLTTKPTCELLLPTKDKIIKYMPYGKLAEKVESDIVIQSSRIINSRDFATFYGYDVEGNLTINDKEVKVNIISLQNPFEYNVTRYVIDWEDEPARYELIEKYYYYRPYYLMKGRIYEDELY